MEDGGDTSRERRWRESWETDTNFRLEMTPSIPSFTQPSLAPATSWATPISSNFVVTTTKNRNVGPVGKVPDLMTPHGPATEPNHTSCAMWKESLRTASTEGNAGVLEDELLPGEKKTRWFLCLKLGIPITERSHLFPLQLPNGRSSRSQSSQGSLSLSLLFFWCPASIGP